MFPRSSDADVAVVDEGRQRARQDCVCADPISISEIGWTAYRLLVRKAKQDISVNSGPFALIFVRLCYLKQNIVTLRARFFSSLLVLEITSISRYFQPKIKNRARRFPSPR